MRKAKPLTKRTVNRKATRKLAERLMDVVDAFGWYGIGGDDDVHTEGAPAAPAIAAAPVPAEPVLTPVPVEPPVDIHIHGQEEPGDEASDEDDYEDDYHEDDEGDSFYANPEDIQIALDNAISSLMKDKVISELEDLDEAPSLSTVLATLFGDEHELTKQAEYFEELINGYEDLASMDDLREAYEVFTGIIHALRPKQTTRRG
jgi:hypothetical protein